MGVSLLFAWLSQKHKNCISYNYPKNVDNLYIDMNALMHNCYNPRLQSYDLVGNDMVKRVMDVTDDMIEKIKPKDILFLAVDGVAPGAKLAHQRGRRYKHVMEAGEAVKEKKETPNDSGTFVSREANENLKEVLEKAGLDISENFINENDIMDISSEESEGKIGFDSNSLTPGSDLMDIFHKGFLKILRYRLSEDQRYKKLRIIYSSYLVPGEGEQKAIRFIRKFSRFNPEKVHLMYSPDGDVIFLGLSLYRVKFHIMREDLYNNKFKKEICEECTKSGHKAYMCGKAELKKYVYVDCFEFSIAMVRTFNSMVKIGYDKRKMINDWIFVCFLIGNDFLPGLPSLDIKIYSMEALTQLMCKNYNLTKMHITNNLKVDFNVLASFFNLLSKLEDSYYVMKSKFITKYLGNINREEIPLHTSSGKLKYYSSKMHAHNQDDIDNICIEYVKGMAWIYNYYILGKTDWEWVYPYHFSPFAVDLVKVMRSNFRLKTGAPLSPYEQLMVVVPPKSKDIVPKEMHYIFDKYKKCYPDFVRLDMFDKYLPWTSIVILPPMNSSLVFKEVRKCLNNLSLEDLDKNYKDTSVIMTSDDTFVKDIYEMYCDSIVVKKMYFGGFFFSVSLYYNTVFPGEEMENPDGKFINRTITARLFDI